MTSPNSPPLSGDPPSIPWSLSSDTLRHPILEADERISNWISRSLPAIMSAPSDSHSDDHLGDSTFEFIDTDEESRDGNATESIASTDFSRPDDLASLADTEQSEEDENVSVRSRATGTSGIPPFTGLDGPVQTPTITQSLTIFLDELDRPHTPSIEFEEPLILGAENVSVKHTIADFNEEQTAEIVERMMLRNPPKRLVTTMRQTMTMQSLSTREPLRILYVGSHEAKQDIIRKIASSVAASVKNDSYSGPGYRPSQVFNVVPVSNFGSQNAPEIELMHSSRYQIEVQDCSTATNQKFEEDSGKPDLLRLTVDDHYSYHSLPEGPDFIVEPAWELPHVAVFYCSENDNSTMLRTRTIAKTFMSRHKVPQIVISHRQLFDKAMGAMTLDQHAIHICLESRDPNGPRNIIHKRLPIDLESFKTIDARQMNRNLAYLTGLHDTLSTAVPSVATVSIDRPELPGDEKLSHGIIHSVKHIYKHAPTKWAGVASWVFLSIVVIFAAFFKARYVPTHSVSINGNFTSTEPMSIITTTTSTLSFFATSLTTATETKTATKTITVTKMDAPISNSVAVKPSMELGKLAEKVHTMVPDPDERTTVCAAEVLGDREVLIRIPAATKLSWLTREAMSVNVFRRNDAVNTERVYNTANGIVLEFSRKEAYGILNISIITTKKPKINETFEVDFGSGWDLTFQEMFGKISSLLFDDRCAADAIFEKQLTQVRELAERALAQVQSLSELAVELNKLAAQQAAESSSQIAAVAKAVSLDLAKRSAIVSKEIGLRVAEAKSRFGMMREDVELLRDQHIRELLDNTLLIAQVRSRLLWLRIQGKHAEHAEYKERAAKARKTKLECRQDRKSGKAARRAAKKEKKACAKACSWK